MASHNKLGRQGENIAKDFLKHRGFIIVAMNWRHLHYEIDIVARQENILVFVEVKTRSTFKYGFPDESIDYKKKIDCESLQKYILNKKTFTTKSVLTLFQSSKIISKKKYTT
tara:strand:+ start:448 stop:783 length:336 start_codon:yes stop_codon:yes gene_type:complete